MKKTFTLLLALVAGVAMLNAEVYSGNCGAEGYNLTWSFNTESSTLTISGTGRMADYTQTDGVKYSYAPWSVHMDGIRKIVVSEGVTYIGDYAFQSCEVDSLIIPTSITYIGKGIIDGLYVPSDDPTIYSSAQIKVLKWDAISAFCSKNKVSYFENDGSPVSGSSVITPLYVGPYGTMGMPIIDKVEIGKDVRYLPNYLFAGAYLRNPIDISCRVSFENNTFAGCEYNVIGSKSYTQLPDTTICYGEWIDSEDSEIRYSYRYVDENCPYSYVLECPECDYTCTNCTLPGSWEDFSSYIHYIDNAEKCPDGMICDEYHTHGIQFHSSGIYSQTYTNSQGCDSVVTRNVNVIHATAPHIEVVPEYDTFNSGALKFYDVYCTNSQYVGYTEEHRDDPYEYTYSYAQFDYITINGVKYDYASKSDSTPSFNDMSYRHPIDAPDYIINNLPAGTYHIVFYSSCDSVVENVTIESKGIEINGMYYQYVPEDYRQEGLKLIYRGASAIEFEDEYYGDIVIPDSAVYNGKKLPVLYIDERAFEYCSKISSITFESPVPLSNDYGYGATIYLRQPRLTIYVPFGAQDAYTYGLHCYYYNYDYSDYYRYYSSYYPIIHVIRTRNLSLSPTSATFTFGNAEEQQHVVSCGIVDGEEYAGNRIEWTGLEPERAYYDKVFYINTKEGDYDTVQYSFVTPELTLTTLKSKPVSSTTAILLAETNILEAEVNCGFEYKRNDAPSDMEGTKVYCPASNGVMAGRLKNLKDDVYYKYRAFYQSANERMFYGSWQYIFTGDVTVEFDPVLYTYDAVAVTESKATLKGYAIAGAEDFTEQGFEYWADGRILQANNAPARVPAALGERKTVQATGIKMQVTLTDLDAGTVYKYRTYAKVGDQVCYGAEMTFTTQGVYEEEEGFELIPAISNGTSRKILYNGQLLILRGDKVYTITGQEVR